MGLIIFVQEKTQLLIKKMHFRTQDSILTKQKQNRMPLLFHPRKHLLYKQKGANSTLKRPLAKLSSIKVALRVGLVPVQDRGQLSLHSL